MKNEMILESIKTGLIDYSIESLENLQPKLLLNDYKLGSKVLSQITKELETCHEFIFSVAFITESGITTLLNTLKDLEKKGIPGKILTTDYLNFTNPKALRRLLKFNNIQMRMYNKGNFHAKGYIFKKQSENTLIVGSANLTQEALTHNKEWNLKINSLDNGQLYKSTLHEFLNIWSESDIIDESLINKYEIIYNRQIRVSLENKFTYNKNNIKPNKMQAIAMKSLKNLRLSGESKALLISATGTGKTYLSAFDVKQFNPQKMLFIVHRENIARKAMNSFRNLLGENNYGLLTGNSKDYNSDFIFTTIQTLSKDTTLKYFSKNHFDYIVIDEVHRSGAKSYLKVINYFEPKFLLGMTATPERTDGFDIFNHFDYNIAHEIRLQDALKEDLLCTFHYFGVSDIEVNGQVLDENSDFVKLTSDERIKHIINTIEFYGYNGDRPKGLIFCSRVEEAIELSNKFNSLGFRTTALSGENSENNREEAINRLETDEQEFALDYIFSVDVFNEGIDIPSVNQIIMLRPTQSAIIFVQQLGRGLRKAKNKEYVIVIDFIGNYQNNFLIPIALSGDRTYNKDTLRRFIRQGNYTIPGSSTVSFDEISKRKIYENINKTNFKKLNFLRKEYKNLKVKIGKIPSLYDFYKYGSIDPQLIIDYSKSYYNFLKKTDKAYNIELEDREINFLEFISCEFMPTKRPHEIIILKELLENESVNINYISKTLEKEFNVINDLNSINSAIKYLVKDFLTDSENKKYNQFIFCNSNVIKIEKKLIESYNRNILFRDFVDDLIKYGLDIYNNEYLPNKSKTSNLSLYKKYSRKEVCQLLNWDKNLASVMYGYMFNNNTCPIFVTYDKNEDIPESIKYQDEFINKNTFSWMTRNKVSLDSNEAQQIINSTKTGLKIHLFIKKADDEGPYHYYIGEVIPIHFEQTTINNNKGKKVPIVNFKFNINHTVREDIYDYILK